MQVFLLLFASIFWNAHELHLSICSVNYNEEAGRIEVQQRIFYDDLEKSLQFQMDDASFNILAPQESVLNYDSLFINYANEHLEIDLNGERIKLDLLEYEISDDAIVLYMYKANVAQLKSINVFSHILFEIFDDQDNVISIQANGKKKSGKFSTSSKPLAINYGE